MGLAQQRFEAAVRLLKDDKMRTFRIDVETDSTVEPDRQAAKEAVTEMATAVGGLLEKALPIGQAMPQLAAPLGQTLLFVLRTFGAGRDVEGIWESAIDDMAKAAKNPQPRPPSPEQIKAQAEAQSLQQKGQIELEAHQMEMQAGQQEAAFKRQEYSAKLLALQEQHKQKLEQGAIETERLRIDTERARIELAKMHAPEQTEPEKGPSESINFKDLPPEGQAQMAQQAGITLTPEALKTHADDQAAQQKALKTAAPPKQSGVPA
jgi:hypothetical protein